jgi:hypothetical protein
VVPDGEWNEFLAALRRNLPLCLRVRRAHPLYALAVAELRQLEAAPVSERGMSSGLGCASSALFVECNDVLRAERQLRGWQWRTHRQRRRRRWKRRICNARSTG